MRWLIALSAFCVPLLLIIALGWTFGPNVKLQLALSGEEFGELRSWITLQRPVIDHYLLPSSTPARTDMPHAVLDRFAARGCDRDGTLWYRSAKPLPGHVWGILLRTASKTAPTCDGGRKPTSVIPLSGNWCYWERQLPETAPAR